MKRASDNEMEFGRVAAIEPVFAELVKDTKHKFQHLPFSFYDIKHQYEHWQIFSDSDSDVLILTPASSYMRLNGKGDECYATLHYHPEKTS